MKRTVLLIVSLCLATGASFAQKRAVKDAKTAMKNNISEARELIKPALTNEETKNDPETWKIAGDIEYKAFTDEREKEQMMDFAKKDINEEAMYTGILNMYAPYLKADELAELPDAKGKVKNKVRANIVKSFADVYPFYINGGAYYSEKKKYSKAADFFEKYSEIPSLLIFGGDNKILNVEDSVLLSIKYYAAVSAMQADEHQRAIKSLNSLNKETYIQNTTFSESDIYELLSSEYLAVKDSVSYVNTLKEGATKFPRNTYFAPNLINSLIRSDKNKEAMDYINQAIANDPKNSCDLYSLKASLFADQKDYVEAEKIYREALINDNDCARSQEGLGVLYVLKAQEIKEKATATTNRKEQAELDIEATELYKQSLPFLEKYYKLLKSDEKVDNYLVRQVLIKLQNVYYNLSSMEIDKSKELADVESEMEKLKDL